MKTPNAKLVRNFLAMAAIFAALPLYAFTVSELQNPYGTVVDAKSGFIYISNVNGGLDAKDDNGYISRLKADGTVDQIRFIDGATKDVTLHAPKGMVILEGRLYVADVDKLRAFDIKTGRQLFDVNFGDLSVQHFYDISTGPDAALYVIDGPGNIVYRVDVPKLHEVTTLVEGAWLGQPHGIFWLVQKQMFVLSSWAAGQVVALDRSGKRQSLPSVSVRTAEGIRGDDAGNIYVASPSLAAVYKIGPDFALGSFGLGLSSPTGLAFDPAGRQIIVTSFDTGTVQTLPVTP